MSGLRRAFQGQRRRNPTGPVGELAEHIQELDAAAETASRRVAQSAHRLRSAPSGAPGGDEDLLAELADALVSRAEAVRAECAELAGLLDRARRLVDADTFSPEAVEGPAGVHAGSGWQGPPAGDVAATDRLEGVRLIATRMAIAGSRRSEIEVRLREQFGVEEAKPVLDEVFGEAAVEAR
jgi:hypothetical protein